MPHAPPQPSLRQAGFSLLEVLVSLVIFSLGVLGMVGMQGLALQANREARIQSQAVSLGAELAELVRGNNLVAMAASNPYLVTQTTPGTTNMCLTATSAGTGCSDTTSVATSQMTDWLARVQDTLPEARVAVCRDSAPYDTEGLPVWACDNNGDALVIKLGWTQSHTKRGQTGTQALASSNAADARPMVVMAVTAGQPL